MVSVPAYRARLLGVYDADTGQPIEGAEVVDVLSHASSLTSKTGTVALVFLPDSGSMIRIQKIGYQPTTMVAAISPADTVPITVILVSRRTSAADGGDEGDRAKGICAGPAGVRSATARWAPGRSSPKPSCGRATTARCRT